MSPEQSIGGEGGVPDQRVQSKRAVRRLPWRRFADLTPAEREHRLSTLAGISYVLMAVPFLIVYVLLVLAVLDA